MVFTARDRDILETLARCVRALTLPQLARTWWADAGDDHRARLRARARARHLARAGVLEVTHALVHPELPVSEPVIAWSPGEPEPDFGPAAYRLRTRWTGHPSPETLVTIAATAAPQFGGYPASALRDDELTHDVHLAAVFLRYRATAPQLAAGWIGERVIRRTHPTPAGPVPDAMIETPSTLRLIEFGGAYSTRRVRSFHDHCAALGVPYEVW